LKIGVAILKNVSFIAHNKKIKNSKMITKCGFLVFPSFSKNPNSIQGR